MLAINRALANQETRGRRHQEENGDGNKNSNGVASRAGIEFIDENGGGPGVRLKKPRTKRT